MSKYNHSAVIVETFLGCNVDVSSEGVRTFSRRIIIRTDWVEYLDAPYITVNYRLKIVGNLEVSKNVLTIFK